jgi:predicted flap endonuclease-1-like 5' DNA nuclease
LSGTLAASNDTIEQSFVGEAFAPDDVGHQDPLDDLGEDLSDVFEAVPAPRSTATGNTGFFSINGADPHAHSDETDRSGRYAPAQDDLKRIKGVGPAIEKTLHELGIFSFRQIADMNEFEIDRVANHLKGFHSRIYREDWIGQARVLLGNPADRTH